MAMSQGHAVGKSVGEILIANIPGAVNAMPAHSSNDRSGTDWWVEHRASKHLSVDCKVRKEDWTIKPRPQDDLALESYSVIEKKIVGWTRDKAKRTDYVLWLWTETGRWCLLPFPMLCAVFTREWENWRSQFQTATQKTPRANGAGYHSECIYVPRKVVWAHMYRQYGGLLKVTPQAEAEQDEANQDEPDQKIALPALDSKGGKQLPLFGDDQLKSGVPA
jgi:hypothetical protein